MLLLATGATNADVTLKGDTIFRNCFIDRIRQDGSAFA